MATASSDVDTLDQVRRLGETVRAFTAELPGDEDDVTDLVEPRPAPVPGQTPDEPVQVPVETDFLSEYEEDDEDLVPPRRHRVTAVLVAHDGARWLPGALTALARSTRLPERIVAVDTGSTDATPSLLGKAVDADLVDRVLSLPADTSFGAAVVAGLAAGSGTVQPSDPDVVRWVWLLHDDCAPAPAALAELLRAADRDRTAEVFGPKVRGWTNPDELVECGVTVARSGNRVTGLERHELDQGQHDGDRDVLAVGSAGMLVRRDVWDELGGFDPSLPLFRDDLDFCWRAHRSGRRVVVATDAVLHHREAVTHGRRPVAAGSPRHPDRPRRLARSASIHVMRAHAPGWRRPLVTARLLVGTILRALALLLAKAPDEARDEWGAFRDAACDRSALTASRARVAASALLPTSVPDADVRRLLAPRGLQARHALATVADLVAGREGQDATRSVLDSTPDDPDGWYAEDRRPSRLRRLVARPGLLLVLALVAVTLVGVRGLLGEGVLLGGALVPAPEGAGDLWNAYLTAWHEVGTGSAADSPAWLLPLTALAGLLRGSATSAVDLLLLMAVPLAGLTSYLALRGVSRSVWPRLWAAAAYATLPAVTGAVSDGRIGSVATIVLLPWLARSCARLVGVGRPGTWRRAFGTALLLAVVMSFTPVVWLVAVPLAVLAGATVVRDLAGRLRLLVTVLTPVALLVPWSFRVVREPALLWLEPGLVGPVDRNLVPLDLVLLRPGGPGSTPLWLGIGIVLAGLVALTLRGGRRYVVAAWAVGFAGLAVGVLQSTLRVTPSALSEPVTPWPGAATTIWAGALIVCAVLVADRVPSVLAGRDFGWRQPATVGLTALLIAAPAVSAVLLTLGVDGPLHRGSRDVVPAFVAASMRSNERPRAIVLQRLPDGVLGYDLLAAPEPQLGDVDVAPPVTLYTEIDRLVARLAAGIGADEVEGLADHGVRFVVLGDAARTDDALVESLDSQRGLRRLSSRSGDFLWELVPVSGRAMVVAQVSVGAVEVRRAAIVRTVGGDVRTVTAIDTRVGVGAPGRHLLLAEAADDRWLWTIGGEPVTPISPQADGVDDPSLQQATLPTTATAVEASFVAPSRTRWLWAQAILAGVVVVLALPSRRREVESDDDAVDETLVPA